MSIEKIITAALEKDAVSLKESLSDILSEKIALALEEKISELQEISKTLAKSYLSQASKNEVLPYHKFKSRIVGLARADAKLKAAIS